MQGNYCGGQRVTITDWDDAYSNAAHIKSAEHFPRLWQDQAKEYRKTASNLETDIAYGEHAREKYDLFRPDSSPKGVLIFVHGGYWMKLDKSSWSHLAEGARANGWAVAIPSYVLAPDARISDITCQIGAAITHILGRVGGPVRLAGHSAGGHLVSRMICSDGPLSMQLTSRIEHVLSISGLHDLRPLMRTKMNQILALTNAEAETESPFLAAPVTGSRLTAWVGANERPEFVRQSRLMQEAWPGTDFIQDAGHHHFSVIAGLADPNSAIVKQLLG